MRRIVIAVCLLVWVAQTAGAQDAGPSVVNAAPGGAELQTVVEFTDRLVTGVTCSDAGRVFVNFPMWYEQYYDGAVAEVTPDGGVRAYPNEEWNAWRPDNRLDPGNHFVCVQSVVADGDTLYVLDPGAPWPTGMIEGAPKLVVIDLRSDEVVKVHAFGPDIVKAKSYLNDIRIDRGRGYAYMTDSGDGAIVTLNLETGETRRLLDDHPSTDAEPVTIRVDGRELKGARIHSDGIALDREGEYLYYHPLTGYHTYRIRTQVLRESADDPEAVAAAVEDLGPDAVTDGMHIDAEGNLYYTALEYDAILRRDSKGNVQPVIIDDRLRWPDTLSIGPDGELYITASQIHRTPRFTGGAPVREPWEVYRLDLKLKRPR